MLVSVFSDVFPCKLDGLYLDGLIEAFSEDYLVGSCRFLLCASPAEYMQNYLNKKVLENLEPNLYFTQYGEKAMAPDGYPLYLGLALTR